MRTSIEVKYRWNGKDEPERLNRAYEMLFAKIIKKLVRKSYEHTQTRG